MLQPSCLAPTRAVHRPVCLADSRSSGGAARWRRCGNAAARRSPARKQPAAAAAAGSGGGDGGTSSTSSGNAASRSPARKQPAPAAAAAAAAGGGAAGKEGGSSSTSFYATLEATHRQSGGEEGDSVALAQAALEHAVAAEDYERAAQLRDSSNFTWLAGWWRPSGTSVLTRSPDALSSLLHVKHPAKHAWRATLYSPLDFLSQEQDQVGSSSELILTELCADPRWGTPLFEVHLLADSDEPASTHITPVVAALQSCGRALNELLHVQPGSSSSSSSAAAARQPGAPALVKQRLLLLVLPDVAVVAAVHAGQDSTLLTWSASLAAGEQQLQQPEVRGPQRPAETCPAAFCTVPSVDGNAIDLLRGPGTISRSADSFTFTRQALQAADVLSLLASLSGSSSSRRVAGTQPPARLFRVELQFALAPEEEQQQQQQGPEQTQSSQSPPDTPDGHSSPPDCGWADRAAASVCRQLQEGEQSALLQASLGALMAAAAGGIVPEGAAVSEEQQPVTASEVPLPAGEDTSDAQAAGSEVAASFTRVTADTVTVGFGAFEVTARL